MITPSSCIIVGPNRQKNDYKGCREPIKGKSWTTRRSKTSIGFFRD
jgi:hypothetical protein